MNKNNELMETLLTTTITDNRTIYLSQKVLDKLRLRKKDKLKLLIDEENERIVLEKVM